ncbi:unnamed protein product [Rhizoctonia solani]|uniref:RecQ-mediated genome instability protein 1 n=1 Tax=Rhizoctonia solani TaxID=456999 RepID=A0A8H3HIE4_9AGAM|nr:unnamed protein product [Rhizoctonia solani]
MAPPPRLVNWLKATYSRPQISLEWLGACYDYITGELGVLPDDFESLKTHVKEQLLQSSLADSAVRDTGFPDLNSHGVQIKNTLCEVVALTEIGHSAFTLKNVRQARVDKEDLAGLAGDLEDGEDYSIPKYPRSMLRFELSDGTKTMRAIEYRRIPDFELGVTQLGTKIYLKEVNVRRGIIYLTLTRVPPHFDYRLPEEGPEADQNFNAPPRQPERQPERIVGVPPAAPSHTAARVANDNPPPPPSAKANPNNAPVVDLDPDDLDVVDYEDSYSIGDGVGAGHDGDIDEGEEDYEIDEAFLQDLDEAEQLAQVVVQDVIDIDEDSQVEIRPPAKPERRPPPAKAEEIIDISD